MNGIQEDGTTFINLDSTTAAHHAAVYESSFNPEVAVITHNQDQRWMPSQHLQYNHYIPVSCLPEYQHSPQETSNKMELLTAAAEMTQDMTSIKEASPQKQALDNSTDATTDNDESANIFTRMKNFYPSTNEASDSLSSTPQAQQISSSTANQMQLALENAERAINCSLPEMFADELVPKITLSSARQLLDSALLGVQPKSQEKKAQLGKERDASSRKQTKKSNEGLSKTSTDGCDKGKDEEKPRRSKRGRRSGTFNMDKQEWTPNTIEERKELHLSKERKRRERIARCWHQLRRLIPMCSDNADKATVFEMTVAYLHHCWKHHAQFILNINKDFERFCGENGPPEDLDEIDNLVTTLLDLEDQ
ncbi:transcription factor-like 5 protein [Actinia tenebrosa]|uniref:Transcription factor-like 5 protein n=1 Tax=Actinia tenebrosa TaxID=6105 RepID=A0A6P8I398_ACTTE|nr:transcription factor-like 5 protein [Actinia tenebrosa]